jgi:hypothetical protein
MLSFISACVAIVVIVTIGVFALSFYQEPVSVAFVTEAVRI